MKVFVIADTDGVDVVFRIAGTRRGESEPSLPPVFRLADANRPGRNGTRGNPYAMYEPALEHWAGYKYDATICVATVSSGDLLDPSERIGEG